MNSEAFEDITKRLAKQDAVNTFDSAERERKESITISEGDLVTALTVHEGWKLLQRQLEEVKEGYIRELLDVSRCDTLKKVHDRQVIISAIELFIASPKAFIDKRNIILDRRRKWQNKKT